VTDQLGISWNNYFSLIEHIRGCTRSYFVALFGFLGINALVEHRRDREAGRQ
jgi:hypothetical protein